MSEQKVKKKRPVRKWILRVLLLLVILGGWFFASLIWFKPWFIDHFYTRVFIEYALDDPELLSQMRLLEQFGMRGHNKKLTAASPEWTRKLERKLRNDFATLESYNRDGLDEGKRLSYDVLHWFLENSVEGLPFQFHDYPVNQLFGIQNNLPTFMAETHEVNDRKGAEHYIARLNKVEWKINGALESLRLREEMGVIPPKFVIEKVLLEMRNFRADPKENVLYTTFQEKLEETDLGQADKSAFLEQAETAIREVVFPAYDALIAYMEEQETKATTDDGVWKLPDGSAYYAYQLKNNTTSDLDPEEVHQLGLREVARIEAEMRAILESQGHEGKTPGEWLTELAALPEFLYPNTDEGRSQIIEEYQRLINHIDGNLESAFDIRPESGVEVKRIAEFKEDTSPGAYYNPPALDGSRPGVFYANLRDTKEIPKFGMATLAYHEAVPGHHFQLAIQQELKGLPIFRRIVPFTAYAEGWALYAEQLAYEMGFYENDPYGNLGRLQAEMFRAVRLVVDTGIHHKRWTREQAIEYMLAKTGMPEGDVISEIERYIVLPGQACAYKIGHLKILELRERAKSELGDRFDIRQFHNVVLGNGSVPLEILEEIVEKYISETKT